MTYGIYIYIDILFAEIFKGLKQNNLVFTKKNNNLFSNEDFSNIVITRYTKPIMK